MRKLHAKSALLPDGWSKNVSIEIDGAGKIKSVMPETPIDHGFASFDILVPALCNIHSHAFQRALTGLTQIRSSGNDDFWSWRRTMYAFLTRLTPDDVETIAAMLYLELARSGFAAVGEFHYLHHQPDGRPYDDPAELAGRIANAAQLTGIGLTLLPVAYARSGFGGAAATDEQRRFATKPDALLALREAAKPHLKREDDIIGVAPHSLRAITPDELQVLVEGVPEGPIHIHIAEQTKEVDDCLAFYGARPVEWLLDHQQVDSRWCLVHATHMTGTETRRLAASEAVAGLCPTTEADLGDGIFPGADYFAAKGRWGVGTDSHVRTDLAEELRLLEWSQRLHHRQRTVMAKPGQSNGRALFDAALKGGAHALGRKSGRIEKGNWADLVSLDPHNPHLAGKHGDQIIDSWIFSGGAECVTDVWSAGRHIIESGGYEAFDIAAERYNRAMEKLLA